jgi:hypothetical protein
MAGNGGRGGVGNEFIELENNGALGSGKRKFRLAKDRGRPLWGRNEVDDQRGPWAHFRASNWRFGVGLDRLTGVEDQANQFRLYDGWGIDLSNGKIEHGPGGTSLSVTLNGTPQLPTVIFATDMWFLTTTSLYRYDGTTLTHYWGPAASGATHQTSGATALKDMEVFEGNLYVSDGTDIYFTSGADDPNTNIVDDGLGADLSGDYLLSIQTQAAPQLWVAHSTNKIRSSNDPDVATPTWSSDIEVGEGEAITNLFSISGLLFVATAAGKLFSISSNGVPTELDKRLKVFRGANAFSIKADLGTETWFSDGSDVAIQVQAVDFEQFRIIPNGPFNDDAILPFTALGTRGDIQAIGHDDKHIYIAVNRGGDIYVYKGAEQGRGVWGWSPLIKIASTTCGFIGVAKLDGESNPYLYVNSGSDIVKYELRDWSKYNLSWQAEFPFFDNGEEDELKIWHRLRVFAERTDDGTNDVGIQASSKQDDNAYIAHGSAFSNSGSNSVVMGVSQGYRSRLKLAMTSTDADDKIDVKSVKQSGVRKPELEQLYDFTVIVDNEKDADMLVDLRREGSAFVLFRDIGGTQHQGIVLKGFPQETVVSDENNRGWLRAFRLVIHEVLSS